MVGFFVPFNHSMVKGGKLVFVGAVGWVTYFSMNRINLDYESMPPKHPSQDELWDYCSTLQAGHRWPVR